MTEMRPFPWDEAIGFGLGVLRLSPHAFWSMTPRELALALADAIVVTGDSVSMCSEACATAAPSWRA